AQVMALLRIDQGLVEAFQYIVSNVAKPEPCDLGRDSSHKVVRGRRRQDPIEEIRFDHALDPHIVKGLTCQQLRRSREFDAQRERGHRLCDDREVGVLKEERVTVYLST